MRPIRRVITPAMHFYPDQLASACVPRQSVCSFGERGSPPLLESISLWHCTHSAGCEEGLRAAAHMAASLSCNPDRGQPHPGLGPGDA
jgi:hypothetical protein